MLLFVYKLVPEVKIYTQHQEMMVSSFFCFVCDRGEETHTTLGDGGGVLFFRFRVLFVFFELGLRELLTALALIFLLPFCTARELWCTLNICLPPPRAGKVATHSSRDFSLSLLRCRFLLTWNRILWQVRTVCLPQTIDFLQTLDTYLDCFLMECTQVLCSCLKMQ